MFNNEFYRMAQQLSATLDELYTRYPDVHPDYRFRRGSVVFSHPSGIVTGIMRESMGTKPLGIAMVDYAAGESIGVMVHGYYSSSDGFSEGDVVYLSQSDLG